MSTDNSRETKWFELSLLVSLGFLWGMPYGLTKISLTAFPPITLVAARVILAAIVLWIFVLLRGLARPNQREFAGLIFAQGFFGCVIPYTLITTGQRSVDSALTAILNSTTPFFVCLITLFFMHQKLSGKKWLGVGLGLGGIVTIAGASALLGLGQSIIGQLAILTGTLSSAVSVILGRRFSTVAPEVTAASALTCAATLLIPLAFLYESPISVTPSPQALVALAINGIFATALGFVLYFRLIASLGSVEVASVGYLKPCFGVMIGWVILGEPVTWTIVVGLLAILSGVAAMNRSPSPNLNSSRSNSVVHAR